MRKFYSFMIAASLLAPALTANAEEFTIPQENAILQGSDYNMRLLKTYDFIGLTVNGKEITPATFTTGDKDDTGMPLCDGYTIVKVTNEGMEGWYMGIGNIEFNSTYGLYNNKNGIRYAVFSGLKAGQILCIQSSGSNYITEASGATDHTYAVNCNRIQKASVDGTVPAWTASYLSNNGFTDVVEEITSDVRDLQNKDWVEGEDSISDGYRYFKVVEDGALYIAFGKYASIQGLQIWMDASAEEFVSTPTMSIRKVDGRARSIEFKAGESTLGSDCSVWWGIADAGEEALYTEDTEEIDHYDYTYNIDPETGDTLSTDSTAVYKKILTPVDGEAYGDRGYEGGYEDVSYNDDEDGDGILNIMAATVSSTGGFSDIVTFQVSIEEIQLNAPTLTLVDMEGTERKYQISFENNTLCGETVTFNFEGDNGEKYAEALSAGDIVSITTTGTVTSKCDGYTDNETVVSADFAGINMVQKMDADTLLINFANPTEEIRSLIMGETGDGCYIENAETGEKTYYSQTEFENGVANDGTDLTGENVVAVFKESGWTWDGAYNHMRATLNVVTEGEGDEVTYSYANDLSNILGEGITVDCPINNGNSQIMNYLGNFNLGLTFMSKPTFTFDRSRLKAGEVVVFTIADAGGSNYMTYDSENNAITRNLVYVAPEDELLSVTLPGPSSGFCHLLGIKFYTYDDLPEDIYTTGVEEIASDNVTPVAFYNVAGVQSNELQKGVNIVLFSDGSVKKVLVK